MAFRSLEKGFFSSVSRIDTGFDFVHPKPTHGPNTELPYVTAGEALAGVEGVPMNNEHINIKGKNQADA